MLRPNKFRPFETRVIWSIGLVLLGAGVAAAIVAWQRDHWRLALASAGILVLAGVYLWAALRGRPL